ncbi:hypothetical protein CAEBREN_03618 [Caenorhabditis brenneri]|uniref:5-oxoprolinase n=1 Tax=Caenorhabditis brenneri TaxID=135651 RepID=G0MZZ4_CAEBE|nr:hypothetical protein CAEBREN_03618 [Caenorhabditis brenneri]
MSLGFAIDRGGTFTDVIVFKPNNEVEVLKVLSVDPANYADAPTEAIRQVLERESGKKIPRGVALPTDSISWIRMGTTVATNALLERKGERIGLLITKGFKDLLFIGNQSRPRIFDFDIKIPEVLYEDVIEVDERVLILEQTKELIGKDAKIETTINGLEVVVEKEIEEEELEKDLKMLMDKGIKSVAVLFLHSFIYPSHEKQAGEIAKKFGFDYVSLSHEVMPMIKVVPRGFTVCADAYLTPKIMEYLDGFQKGFTDLSSVRVNFMQSDGGLCEMKSFRGSRAILSGPAGGVVGIASTAYKESDKKPIIGFDMGGTSTDVCRYSGHLEHVMETTTAGITIQAPQLDIHTVAAGGGSRLFFRDGLLIVGPESASAHPGPVALGFLSVANEEMCRPIRTLTQSRGFNPSEHVLACFGGAGGQHACAVAKVLGISHVRIHKYASLLSAYGIALADVVDESQTPAQFIYEEANFSKIYSQFMDLRSTSIAGLKTQGFSENQIETKYFMHMRYEKTDTAIMISWHIENEQDLIHFKEEFRKTYRREFGFVLEDRNIIIDDVRIRTRGKAGYHVERHIEKADENQIQAKPKSKTQVYFENVQFVETSIFLLEEMLAGQVINGPALLIDKNSTIVIEPSSSATITEHGNVELRIGNDVEKDLKTEVDPIRLAIFSNRFMSIAEQMGRILQRTAISTNIKERLDFSCALFAPDGGLIANAPHIPVHLGGMQYTVKFQIDHRGIENIKEGDVYLANHPLAGGCHLPDFTVITPVFLKNHKTPVFFVANRGHHADIGGLVPGSMPPNAHHIAQEGAAFISFKLVDEGVFQEDALIEALKAPGKVPGCSAARNISDNIADLNAQIAANRKGIQLVTSLIDEYSLDVVHAYMQHIQNTAELCVREMLKKVGKKVLEETGKSQLSGEDYMDDGTVIKLTVDINIEEGSAVFDFAGTGPESYNSTNAPRAVTMSAITYCLRCLVEKDIPLNNGCLVPIQILIPDATILSPAEEAPVVAGNVLTSQRLCDVIFRTFDVVAASQGCMNNLVFGDEKCGYYETIAGGAGAGNGFDGRSGVHTHMTNTRITDPEILENRFPVVLREWKLRDGSGGNGKWRGGDGVVRQLEFTRKLTMSLLTERRAFEPYGLHGGQNGRRGLNLLKRKGRAVNIGSKASFDIEKGDILCILTPGGGGYGEAEK